MTDEADPVFSFTLLFRFLSAGVHVMKQRQADAYQVAERFLRINTSHDALQLFREFGPYSVSEGEVNQKLRAFAEAIFYNPNQAPELFRAQENFLADLTTDPIRLGAFYATARPISFSMIQAEIAFYRDALANWPNYFNTFKKVWTKFAAISRMSPEQRRKVRLDKEIIDDPRMELNLYLGQNLPLELIFEKQQAIARCQDIQSALRATVFLDNLGIDNPSKPPWRICARPDCGEIFRVVRSTKQKFCSDACNHLQAVRNYNKRKYTGSTKDANHREKNHVDL